jgi:oxalate decarboxylase
MMRSFPVDALSENLHTPEAVIKSFPQEIVLVTQGSFPPPPLAESTNQLPSSPMFTVEDGPCKDLGKGGYIYEVKSDIFPAATSMSGGLIHLETGSLRTIHWHPNADEMHYVINGTLKVSVYGIGGQSETYVIEAGDIGFVPKGFAHYLEAVNGPADILVTFNDPKWQNQELSTWMAVTPPHLTATSLQTTEESIAGFPKSAELFYGVEVKECPRRVRRY